MSKKANTEMDLKDLGLMDEDEDDFPMPDKKPIEMPGKTVKPTMSKEMEDLKALNQELEATNLQSLEQIEIMKKQVMLERQRNKAQDQQQSLRIEEVFRYNLILVLQDISAKLSSISDEVNKQTQLQAQIANVELEEEADE